MAAEVMDRSLKLTWSVPSDLGEYTVDRYYLMFISNPPGSWLIVNDVTSGHVIENLENGKEYQTRVLAVTQNTELDLMLNGKEQQFLLLLCPLLQSHKTLLLNHLINL